MNIPALEAFIFDKMTTSRFPGLSIAVVKGDDVIYARGFGQADIARAAAATPDTIYGAASITKSFTAIAILQLAQRGLLDLNDPVDKHIAFPIPHKDGPIRIKHLLSHTQGIAALGYLEALLGHHNNSGGAALPIASPKDIPTFMQGGESCIHCAPGDRWFYFNEGYVLLGEIVAKLSGKSFEQYVRDNIFQPLGMHRSMFSEADVTAAGNVAVPYVLPPNDPARPGKYLFNIMGGDANLMTSVTDLAKYLSMFLRRGKPVMSESSYNEMIEPRITTPHQPASELFGDTTGGSGITYCYALGRRDFFGEPMLGHAGMVFSSTGHIACLPKSGYAVTVLGNSSGYPMVNFAQVALACALDKDPESLPFLKIDKILKTLEGRYEGYKSTVKADIKREGDFLRVQMTYRQPAAPPTMLVPLHLNATTPRFFTYESGTRMEVPFAISGNEVEVIYERYKLKRVAPLSKS
jgi:CubicO group peptidase (beta-lactamase class C family)